MRARARALVALLARASLAFADLDDASERREIDDYHYVFSADCQPYMTGRRARCMSRGARLAALDA